MLNEFKSHIKHQFELLTQKPFLLACSGGLDSVVLAHLCHQSKLDFHIAHCNFNLRGEESDGDAFFTKKLAKSLNIKFHATSFNTIDYVNKNKVSIEMAARELRYDWFAKIMTKNELEILVTAHHADDDLETFLINLSRGTGIDGLKGISAKTPSIFRPLLAFSQEDILQFAKKANLEWREDSSNQDTIHLRNQIRHEVVPELKKIGPAFLKNFKKTQKYLADSKTILDNHAEALKSRLFEHKNGLIHIYIEDLNALQPQKAYLHLLLKDYGFTAWDDISSLLTGMSGKEVRSKTHRIVKDRTSLILEKLQTKSDESYVIEEVQESVEAPVKMKIEKVDEVGRPANNSLYVDKDSLKFPLVIRKWEKGDYFYPLGMQGKKKLSKYFKDEKIDVISKDKQWLLCSGDDIVWVIGKRADERFKVTPTTKKILCLTCID